MGTVNTNYVPKGDSNASIAGLVNSGITDDGTNIVHYAAAAATGSATTQFRPPSNAQGNRGDLAIYATFQGTGDNGARRTADVIAGFNGGAWGSEYLTLNVGNNGGANDSQVVTSEKMRIISDGSTGIGLAPISGTTTGLLQLNGGVMTCGTNLGLSGNLYYQSGWKYYTNGSGGFISLARSSTVAIEFNYAANGTGAASASVATAMVIDTQGRVGVGTSSPVALQHVIAGGTVPSIVIPDATNNRYSTGFGSTNVGGVGQRLDFYAGDSGANGTNLTSSAIRMSMTAAGNVGIATTDPIARLDIRSGIPLVQNNVTTVTANPATVDSEEVISIRNNAGIAGLTFGAGDTRMYTVGVDTDNSIYTRANALTMMSATTTKFYAGATTAMYITSTGTIGVNTTTPGTYKLNVNGTFYSAGSSREYKTDITTYDVDTSVLMAMKPVTYQYKDEYKHLGKPLQSGRQIGLIAEDSPADIQVLKEEDGVNVVRNVDYEKLAVMLLVEVQKLRKELNELKSEKA